MYKFKTQPYKHQLECLQKFGRKEYYALLAEMGTGKTWIVINDLADLWGSRDCYGALVLAPNGVHTNWTHAELPRHMPEWVEWKTHTWHSTQTKADKESLQSLMSPGEHLRILAMNWEALQTKKGFETAQAFLQSFSKPMIVCDESDYVKNPSAKRTKALMKLKPYSTYRRIMTGTPITNSPFDAFAQFSFLDENILETTSFYAFKAEYAELLQEGNPLLSHIKAKGATRGTPQVVARGPGGRPKYKNLERLSRLIEPRSFRVLKSDCLDLPEKVYKAVYFDITKEQQEVYNQLKEDCRIAFNNKETVFNKLVVLGKLAQVTSGYFLHPEATAPVRIEGANPKLDLLVERTKKVLEQGSKIIIWARYTAEIDDIMNALANFTTAVRYDGKTKLSERQDIIDTFQNDNDCKVMVSNQQAGGVGITLHAANVVIYYSNSFSLHDRLQSEDRAHRIGQKRNVTYINLIGRKTIDEYIVNTLVNKKEISEQIVNFNPVGD